MVRLVEGHVCMNTFVAHSLIQPPSLSCSHYRGGNCYDAYEIQNMLFSNRSALV